MIKVKCAVTTIMQKKFLLCRTWQDKNDFSPAFHYKTIGTLVERTSMKSYERRLRLLPLCAVMKIIKSMYAGGKIPNKSHHVHRKIRGNSLVNEILMDL